MLPDWFDARGQPERLIACVVAARQRENSGVVEQLSVLVKSAVVRRALGVQSSFPLRLVVPLGRGLCPRHDTFLPADSASPPVRVCRVT